MRAMLVFVAKNRKLSGYFLQVLGLGSLELKIKPVGQAHE